MEFRCYRCKELVSPQGGCACPDGICLVHGDCRDVLTELEPGCVDLLLTDPPYGVAYVTAWRSRNDKLRKPVANDESLDVVAEAWPLAMATLREDRHWYAFASPRMLHDAIRVFGQAKHTLCWDKGDRGTVGDLECGFGEAWEAILYGMKGRRALNGKRPRTVIRHDWSATMDPVHPTVKPVALLNQLVAWSSSEGELILDPFAGSGTTGRSAKDLKRKCLMVEQDAMHVATAAQRLRQEVLF